jgi:hypothetical protein
MSSLADVPEPSPSYCVAMVAATTTRILLLRPAWDKVATHLRSATHRVWEGCLWMLIDSAR